MSKKDDDEFRSWRWDREFWAAGQTRLTIERAGHQVSLDRYGVSIDGQRVVRDNLALGADHGFDVRADGTVLYRNEPVAHVDADHVTVYDEAQRRRDEEAERARRDDRYRSSQQHHRHEIAREQEMSL